LEEYKYAYIWKLYKQKIQLEKIRNRIKRNVLKLESIQYRILLKEIKFIFKKIDFLKNVYDFEANKLDKNYKVTNPELDYDYYNKKFFWVTRKNICEDIVITHIEKNNQTISREELIELLEFTSSKVDWFKYKFWQFVIMSHWAWILNIPTKKYYSLREIITLFFHEMTHFFRRYNNLRNYWTSHWFLDYMKLEEWIALYNEYYYWKKIIKWLKYNPYYEACFSVLLNHKYSETTKKEKIYDILKTKWYNQEKALYYYYRFYRYSSFWSSNLFLKDLIYSRWYRSIKKLMKYDSTYYDIIFSWKIWVSFIKYNIYDISNNFDVKTYFSSIFQEIKKKLV